MRKVLLISLIFLVGLSGCFKMKDSGQKSQSTSGSVSENESEKLVSLRAGNKRLSRENEYLKTVNAEMQGQLKNLEKRDEQLSQKIKMLEADLRQQTFLTEGLLKDNKAYDAEIEELRANLDAWKKQKTPAAKPGK